MNLFPNVKREPESSTTIRALQASVGLFVYVVAYLALRLLPNQAYAGYLNTGVQSVGDAACALLAFAGAKQSDGAWRGFFRWIGIASVCLLIANFMWGFVINIWHIDPNRTVESLAYRVPYLFCLAFWTFAWLELVVRNVNRSAGLSLVFTAICVGGALAALLVRYYGPLILDSANPHRAFVFLYVGLEIAALLFCTGAAIIEIHPYPLLIAVGYALLVASDFVFNTNELRDTIPQNGVAEIPWTVAQVCIAVGLRTLQTSLSRQEERRRELSVSNVSAHFAIPLLSLTLGSGLAGSLIMRFVHPDTASLACYLFLTVASAIGISVVARSHHRALGISLQETFAIMHRGQMDISSKRGSEVLNVFGSAAVLDEVRTRLVKLRSESIPEGPDRMFSVEDAWTEEKRQVFIAMAFTQPWSHAIDVWLRGVIEGVGWVPARADDLFDTRDILDGIWRGICQSQIVVADLTGRNPNVLYEVGIAHCLAKPVVFLCQSPADIPFDLATRKVVIYNVEALEEATSRLRKTLEGCLPGEE